MRFNSIPMNGQILAFLLISTGLLGCLSPNHEKMDAQLTNYESMATFYVDSVTVGQNYANHLNSWNLPSSKLLTLTACLKDIGAMAPILGRQPFSLSDETGKSQTFTTDYRGCFIWEEHHEFDYFAPETYVKIKRTITALGAHRGAVDVSLAFDPWTDDKGGVVNLKIDQVPSSKLDTSNAQIGFDGRIGISQDGSAVLDVKNISLDFLGLNLSAYKIDKRLNLSVAHSYLLQFTPSILRTGIDNTLVSKVPDMGKIRLSIVLLPESTDINPDPKKIIAAFQKEITIQRNAVNERVTFEFPDLAAVTSRVRAIVEFEPIIENPSLKSAKFDGAIGPLPEVAKSDLVQSKFSAASLFAAYNNSQKSLALDSMTGTEIFEKYSGFTRLTMKDLAFQSATSKDLDAFIKNKQTQAGTPSSAFWADLCRKAYPAQAGTVAEKQTGGSFHFGNSKTRSTKGESAIAYCFRQPLSVLAVDRRQFVEDLKSPVPTIQGHSEQETLKISATFEKGVSEETASGDTWSQTKGWTMGANLGIGANINIGVGDKLPKACPTSKNPGPTIPDGGNGGSKTGGSGKASQKPVETVSGGCSEGPVHLDWSAGLNGGANAGLSVARGDQWYTTVNHNKNEKTSTTVTQEKSMTISSVSNTFSFDATVRSCAIIGPQAVAVQAMADQNFKGFFFCSEQTEEKRASETFYLLSQTNGSKDNPFSDANDAREMPLRMFIRGNQVYSRTKAVLSNPGVDLLLKAQPKESDDLMNAVFDLRLTQDYPGMLSE